MPEAISKIGLYTIMTGMLITGSANTLVLKWQDDTYSECNKFTHPYFQGMVMFLGEFSCWIFYFVKKRFIEKPPADNEADAALALSPGG
jgi:hypothetical protein